MTWETVTQSIRQACHCHGLDLVQPLAKRWYDDAVAETYRLPDINGRTDALAVLVGNTRALWPRFVEHLRTHPEWIDDPAPLDRYVVASVDSVMRDVPFASETRFSHEPVPRMVVTQRCAQVSGLAQISPGRVNVHPTYGQWIAFRAVIVVDIDGPPGPAPLATSPCDACETRCAEMFRRALARSAGTDAGFSESLGPANWRDWLAARDSCPVGVEHRYSEEQILYHYTRDRAVLRRAIGGLA